SRSQVDPRRHRPSRRSRNGVADPGCRSPLRRDLRSARVRLARGPIQSVRGGPGSGTGVPEAHASSSGGARSRSERQGVARPGRSDGEVGRSARGVLRLSEDDQTANARRERQPRRDHAHGQLLHPGTTHPGCAADHLSRRQSRLAAPVPGALRRTRDAVLARVTPRVIGESAMNGSGKRENETAGLSGELLIGDDFLVARLGLGTMRLTGKGIWGEPADRNEAIRVVRRAVELGVNFIDTADSYGPHVSEGIIADALYPYPEGVVVATKGGFERPGPDQWVENGRPEHLKSACEGSLRRPGLHQNALYQISRDEPKSPAG